MTSKPERPRAAFADALRTWHACLAADGCPERLAAEDVPLAHAIGRIPAHVARTKHPCPTYRAAAMDGFALRSAQTKGARAREGARLSVTDDAIPIDTGEAMPDGFDCVVPIEDVEPDAATIRIARPVEPGANVRLPGEDVPPGVAVGWPGFALRPLDCAALIASGCTTIEVVKRPRLTVVPTGDEVVGSGSEPKPGTVIDSNSPMIAAEACRAGADVEVAERVRDEEGAIERALRAALERSDIVVLLAGSSAGRRDRGASALAAVGSIDVRGVATRPSRPVILGHAGAIPIVDLPGYPVSCHLAFAAFVAPLIRRLSGRADPAPRRARLAAAVDADPAMDEWRVGALLTAPGSPRAVVVPGESIGGSLYRLAAADARFHLKRDVGRFGRHAAVPYEPLRAADAVARPLFVGPYDPLIEELAALGGFRCRWTRDETGEALDEGSADAVGVVVRGGSFGRSRLRAGRDRKMLPIGLRSEGVARARLDGKREPGDESPEYIADGDPWSGAAAVAAGVSASTHCSRYVASRFGLAYEEREPAMYTIVWEDRPGHRFPWGIVLVAGLSALSASAAALGWKNIGSLAGGDL